MITLNKRWHKTVAYPTASRPVSPITAAARVSSNGEWLPWIEANLEFSRYTVANYIRVFEHREKLKCGIVTHLTDAYRLLADTSEEEEPPVELSREDVIARERQKEAEELKEQGLSQRQIGAVPGVGVGTVNRDLSVPNGTQEKTAPVEKQSRTVPNATPLQSLTNRKTIQLGCARRTAAAKIPVLAIPGPSSEA